MQELLSGIHIQICGKVYLKDPQSSELGKKIIAHSIDMIEELGFDQFTFRKLSKELATSEASIYCYFESKHKLLRYLTAWYWNWLELRLLFFCKYHLAHRAIKKGHFIVYRAGGR